MTKKTQKKQQKEEKTIEQLEKEQNQEDDSDMEIPNDEMSINSVEEQEENKNQEEGNQDDEEIEDDENLDEEELAENEKGEDYDELEGMEFDENEDLEGACDEEDDGQEKLLTDKEQVQKSLLQKNAGADQAIINMKIHEIVKILTKFKELRDPSRDRQSYMTELNDYLCQYYSYNKELMGLFQQMFSPNELIQFLEANEQQRVLTIRTNTLKTRRKELAQILIQRGVNLDVLAEWSKVGIKIYDSKIPVGATPEYLAGHYMLQSASSFLPVIALAPQMNERVLDMAAAPGGKTSYIAQLMKNTGTVFANDIKADRLKGLFYNIQRLGINNTVVCNYDGRKFPKVMRNFDRVLLDAPCTGLGIISRDHSIKANKLMIDVYKHAHLQRELILSAIDCCKKGGYIVYSTCSVAPQENEAVVNYALKMRHVKICDPVADVGEEGLTKFGEQRYHPEMKKTRRIYPHIHNLDGFYFAKLKKLDNGSKIEKKSKTLDELEEEYEVAKNPKWNRSKQRTKKQQKRIEFLQSEIRKLKGDVPEQKGNKKKKQEQQKKSKKQKKFEQKNKAKQEKAEKQQNEEQQKQRKNSSASVQKEETEKKQRKNSSSSAQKEQQQQKTNNKKQQQKKQQEKPEKKQKQQEEEQQQKPAKKGSKDLQQDSEAKSKQLKQENKNRNQKEIQKQDNKKNNNNKNKQNPKKKVKK